MEKKKKPYYRCPDGKMTTSTSRYVSAWRKLAKVVGEALSSEAVRFDPDILFEKNIRLFTLDVDVCMTIYKLATGKDFKS